MHCRSSLPFPSPPSRCRAPEVYAAYYERRFDVSELLADVRALQDRIPSTSTPENDELRRHVVKVEDACTP